MTENLDTQSWNDSEDVRVDVSSDGGQPIDLSVWQDDAPVVQVTVESGIFFSDTYFGDTLVGKGTVSNPINVAPEIVNGAAAGATAVQPTDLATVATTGSYNDLIDKPTLGTAAAANTTDFATAAQGEKADTAVQPGELATVATSGSYNDLDNKPIIPAAQVNSDWDANSGVAQILNKPTLGTAAAASTTDFATAAQGAKADTAVQPGELATVATSGNYNDLSNKPTIPDTTNMQVTTNLVTSVSSASTDLQYPSAKLFYDTCGDIETLINAL